jgi:ABC-type Fe3+ transport system permease subunit
MVTLIIQIAVTLVVCAIVVILIGYDRKIPSYSRKKMLEGYSVRSQMKKRYMQGEAILYAGKALLLILVILFVISFIVLEFMPVKDVIIAPKHVQWVTGQSKTAVIADGNIYTFDKAHPHIKKVYFLRRLNIFGTTALYCDNVELVIKDEVRGR